MTETITFTFVVGIAKNFANRNFDAIPNDWEKLVRHWIDVKQDVSKSLKKRNPETEEQIMFAQDLLKDFGGGYHG